jgi:hypothetical protein
LSGYDVIQGRSSAAIGHELQAGADNILEEDARDV